MSIFIRAITYAALFIGIFLIYVPARLLTWVGIARPAEIGVSQVIGIIVGTVGAMIALWCIYTFVWVGQGTPAPFEPPRRLVIRGPYRFVRNPMYIGAGLALAGASLFYKSLFLLGYAGVFLLICHLFVISYEEPTLRRTFGSDYELYCRKANRWRPVIRHSGFEDQ
jgi:protein-S-isoprenylcysteine O-methyltransferase Ste14